MTLASRAIDCIQGGISPGHGVLQHHLLSVVQSSDTETPQSTSRRDQAMSTTVLGGGVIRLDTDHTVPDLMAVDVSGINRDIRMRIRQQRVHLTGSVCTWHEKQLAQESLRSVSRSFVIQNDISVAGWN